MTQGLAGQMQPICRAAGADVLELTLPEEEDEEHEQAELAPTDHGKRATVKAEPLEEVQAVLLQALSASKAGFHAHLDRWL